VATPGSQTVWGQLQERLLLLLHLRPRLWLARRTDITTVRDVERVSWSMALQIQIDLKQLGIDYPEVAGLSSTDQILLPLLTRARALLTRFEMHDQTGQNVPMLTWDQSRSLVGNVLTGSATAILRGQGLLGAGLDPAIIDAFRRFGGDLDEVDFAVSALNGWAAGGSRRRNRQSAALLRDRTMSLLLGELADGFLVVAPVSLRVDGTCDLYIVADSPIEKGFLGIPVGTSPQYQFEVRLPAGVVFDARPDLRWGSTDELVPIAEARRAGGVQVQPGVPKPVVPWCEVYGPLLAGYAPNEARDEWWGLRLLDVEQQRTPLRRLPKWLGRPVTRLLHALGLGCTHSVPRSIRNTPYLPIRVRLIAWLTFGMLFVAMLARFARIVPIEGVPSPLLVALPSAYAILLLQASDVPTREAVSQRPRFWLGVITLLTFVVAADLTVRFTWAIPGLDKLGIGPRTVIWVFLTGLSFAIARHVTDQSRRVW
jgi:hypothetical protein